MTTCSRCKNIVEDGGRLCDRHRRQKRTQQMRARKLRSFGICYRCGARDSLPLTKHCARCSSYFRERMLPHLVHNLEKHAELFTLSCNPLSQCIVTGRSLVALRKVGQRLTVDRLNSRLGYVDGNMQLMAGDLNSAKGIGEHVPQSAINRLLAKLQHTKDDRLSLVPGATQLA
jgi:hypothetical protein